MEKINTNLGKLKGELVIHNLTTGEIKKFTNLVVNSGKLQLFYLAGGNSSAYFDWLGIGTGTSTPSATDTTLETEIGNRTQVSSKAYTTSYFEFTTIIPGDKQIFNWKELGMFNASSSGTMFSRISVDYTHNSGEVISVSWRWTLS